MKIYELLTNNEEEDFVEAISLVDRPAIEENWRQFKKSERFSVAQFNSEKKIVTGPAMIPNKLIFRYDEETNEEYYVWFRSQTIAKLAQNYLKKQRQFNSTVQHEEPVENVYLFESWIVEDPEVDKAKVLGYEVPTGTWMVSMKVENEEIWQQIKTGLLKGFSIEGWFADKLNATKNEFNWSKFKLFIFDENISNVEKIRFLEQLRTHLL